MRITNYLGPLTFIEVPICGMLHIMRVLRLFLKFADFTLKRVHVLKTGPFRVGLHRILTIFSDFRECFRNSRSVTPLWVLHTNVTIT